MRSSEPFRPAAHPLCRRRFLAASARGLTVGRLLAGGTALAAPAGHARIVITLDLEMCRNFPAWGDTHWDYEEGNLDADTKRYAVEAGRRVKQRGGRAKLVDLDAIAKQADR